MSFWEDLSSPVKGALVVGVIGIIGSVLLWAGVFDGEPEQAASPSSAASRAETAAARRRVSHGSLNCGGALRRPACV
jgi:hypothetical protein